MFELALPNQPESRAIIADLAAAVLSYVGYAPDAIADVAATLRDAVADASMHSRNGCLVAFRAHDGELQIAVRCGGADRWQTARPLP